MESLRVLVVDDDDVGCPPLKESLTRDGFQVRIAKIARDALGRITNGHSDVLKSDLHVIEARDGFTVVSAMRHTHPWVLTNVLGVASALDDAIAAILAQADAVPAKPFGIPFLRRLMRERLGAHKVRKAIKIESVADILKWGTQSTIRNWSALVEADHHLDTISLIPGAWAGHLSGLLRDLIVRVDLQISVFPTLQDNLRVGDFGRVLREVVAIADEADAQSKTGHRRLPRLRSCGVNISMHHDDGTSHGISEAKLGNAAVDRRAA